MLIHVVKQGETLYRIANLYRVSTASIIEVNELPDPNKLVIGQALVIPTEDIVYTVKAGDVLWRIAQAYNTTTQALIQRNPDINPNNLRIGQVLYIPAPRHRVVRGETLSMIARRYGVSLQNIIQVNNVQNPDIINPGIVLIIPIKQRPYTYINGYIYILGEEAVPIVNEVEEHLTYLSPFAYLIKEDGTLQSIKDESALRAVNDNVTPMMAITNFTSTFLGENLAHVVLSNSQIIERLLSNIINIMRQKGYKGLNVDFENVLPADRELYNQFLEKAVARLHPQGYFVSTALAPKISGTQQGLLYEAHDYEAHGRIVDFVVLMTYEWGWRKGPPRAISPINEITRVLDYAVTVIPRNKIFLGFQIYARDWQLPFVQGQEAETFSPQEAIRRATEYGTIIRYDVTAQSPYFKYTDRQGRNHEVWFEDARSAQAKFDLVKSYNLRGVSYWALGYPYPQNWALLEDNFIVRKL